MDEPIVHDCESCGIRHRARQIGEVKGANAEVDFRIPHCLNCCHNPNRGIAVSVVRSMGLSEVVSGTLEKLFPSDLDHWIPIEDGTMNPRGFMKRCHDCDLYRKSYCKVSDDMYAKTPIDECPIVYEMEST